VLAGAGVSLVIMGLGLASNRSAHLRDDPAYCASCHSVEMTLDSLAAGGHDEMSCLECHATSFGDQARMGIAEIVGASLPEEHPTFSNRSSCESCHSGEEATSELRTEGIAAHEAHLSSPDDEVAGMACTSCHVVEDHGFTPTTAGCTAARCHSDIEVRLGRMAHEDLDCADCHALPDTVIVADTAALVPSAVQCLSCHAMQEQLPDHATADEPHGENCNWCHKPHEQERVQEAARTCTGVGCHSQPDTLAGAHRGLAAGVLEDCVGCHAPHQAHVEQQDCLACHDAAGGLLPGVTGPAPPGTPGSDLPRRSASGVAGVLVVPPVEGEVRGGIGGALGSLRGLPEVVWAVLRDRLDELRHAEAWLPPTTVRHAARDTTLDARFDHEEHTSVECVSCHTPDGSEHGQLVVVTASDCRQCHHLDEGAPECATCHEGAEPGGAGIVRPMILDLSVFDRATERSVPFSHAEHAAEDCATCHLPSLTRTAEAEDCQSCHVEHHESSQSCMSCHVKAPDDEHPLGQVHLGCGGAGCHTDAPAPLDDRLRERATCLSCHTAQAEDHYEPATACAVCHVLPPAHGGGAP
jgi:hypothetical protein